MINKYRELHMGFTLIELLVVIAIIGLISAVVVASLNGSREKSSDGNIKQNLKTVLTQSQLYYENNRYKYGSVAITAGTVCPTGTTGTMFADDAPIKNAIVAATTASASSVTCSMSATGDKFSVWARLKTSNTWWCVDNTGVIRSEPFAQGTYTYCP